MQRVIIALILIIIAVSTYLFLNKPETSENAQTDKSTQPQSSPSQPTAADTEKAAKKVIKSKIFAF